MDRIICGETLNKIIANPEMPSRQTFYGWLANNETLRYQYARAREEQQDFYADQIIEIADNELIPPDRARIMGEARRWHAAKLAPKKYGDKLQTETTATIKVQHTRKLDISGLTDDQLDALEGALSATVLQLSANKAEE